MGLFSSKKKIYVSSTVMNLNGSDNSSKFVPSTIVGGAMAGEQNLGQYFIDNLLQGQGISFRKFYKWSVKSGYSNAIGLGSSVFYTDPAIDKEALENALIQNLGINPNSQFITLEDAYIDFFDKQWVAEQWTSQNRPDLMGLITEVETTNTLLGWHYETRREDVYDEEGHKSTIRRKVKVNDYRQDLRIEYSDGTKIIITKTEYNEDARYLYITYLVSDFVLVEVPADPKPDIPAVDEEGNPILDKDGNQIMIPQEPDPPTYIKEIIQEQRKFIAYQEGGNTPWLNGFFNSGSELTGSYFPYIPVMHDGKWLSDSHMPDIYTWAKKAYKKLYGKNKFDNLVNNLKKSDGINECKFIYEQLGVSINTAWSEGKRYIFEFFYNIYINESLSSGKQPGSSNEPSIVIKYFLQSSKKRKTIFIKSDHGVCNFNNRISWRDSFYVLKNGKIFPGAKKNDYRIYRELSIHKEKRTDTDNEGNTYEYEVTIKEKWVYMEHQISPNRYERLALEDLINDNVIYGGKAVSYNGYDELEFSGDEIFDENTAKGESGFLVPLEYNSFKEAGIIADTDLAKASQYLVCNSYKVKKIRWYQRGIFKVVMAIVAIALSVVTGGGSLGAYFVTMGFSTMAASVIAGVIYAAISIVVSTLVMPLLLKILVPIFGEVIGTVLATVASIIISYGACSYISGASLAWGELCTVSNLLTLTSSVADGISMYIQKSTQNLLGGITAMTEELAGVQDTIKQKTLELFSRNSLVSREAILENVYVPESPKSFLTRTLVTGSVNAQLSLDMVYNFCSYTLKLTNPITE